MKTKNILFWSIVFLGTVLVAACSGNVAEQTATAHSPVFTENTPAPPQELIVDFIPSRITLLDGSILYLDEETEIQILSLDAAEALENRLLLNRGRMMVISQQPAGTWFTIQSPAGYMGRVTGSIIIVRLDVETGNYYVACIEGSCEYGDDPDNMLSLEPGFYALIDPNGNVIEIAAIVDFEAYEYFEEYIPGGDDLPSTPTPSSTPDEAATATAVCAEIQSEAPGSHCPEP